MTTQSTSRASSPSSETVQIIVNTSAGKSIPLKVQPSNTISNVLEFLSASTTLFAESTLVLSGKQLDPSLTVGELKLDECSALNLYTPSPPNSLEPESSDVAAILTLPSADSTSSAATSGTSTPTSTKRKSSKPRCTKEGCKAVAQPIVGECGFCSQRFCGKHRMLEAHNCAGLADARQADKDRNTAKLEHERTVMLRGL